MEMSAIQKAINQVVEFFVNYSFQVVGALIVLLIGFMIAAWAANTVLKMLQKQSMDITLSKFIAGTLRVIILAFAVIIALGKFGITIAPFIAALSAAALGASFAIQGPLSNYGAGFSIILSRPFSVGNTITVKDVSGVVQDIKLANTTLLTEDGIQITIPNNQIVGEILHNSRENHFAEGVVGISYSSEPEAAIAVIRRVFDGFKEVVKTPGPQVGIQSFGDSSVNIAYRYWVPTVKHFQITGDVNLAVFKALKAAKIEIPFPQREVRILSQTVGASS